MTNKPQPCYANLILVFAIGWMIGLYMDLDYWETRAQAAEENLKQLREVCYDR